MTYQMGGDGASSSGGRKKKFALLGVTSIFLVAMVVAVAVGVSHKGGSSGSSGAAAGGGEISASKKAVEAICQPTDYKDACVKSLSSAGNTTDPKELVKLAFQATIDEISSALNNSTTLKDLAKDPMTSQALENCNELMDYAIDNLKQSFGELGEFDIGRMNEYAENMNVWLSAALTYQQTCLDGFDNSTSQAGEKMKQFLKTSSELTSNGLAMVDDISSVLSSLQIPGISRRLLTEQDDGDDSPSWVEATRRSLLSASPETVRPNVVVAKDGSGKYRTVNESLKDIPKNGNNTFVIYIKAGVYEEQILLTKHMTHVMLIGDGPTKTRITGSKNFIDGTQTFKTSTVSVVGNNFLAKDIGFENSAGPTKHQAVALRVQSDMSAFYNCHIDGYQDTLYTHAHRQFYHDCTITGTIDFVFGDAAAVFQNCKFVVRKPLPNQQCIVTAHGRIDRREATGLVLQNCTISADHDLDINVTRSYLGRPWKEYSRTIIMQTQIDKLIHTDGWLPWLGEFGLKTCYYSEYENRGPGSATTGRVKWRGIKTMDAQKIAYYTASIFISGDRWVKSTGVPYNSGMMAL